MIWVGKRSPDFWLVYDNESIIWNEMRRSYGLSMKELKL